MQDGNNGKTIVRYAMEYGIYFGLFLIVKFLITTQSTKFIALNVLAEILFVSIPFVLYYLMKMYRNKEKGRVGFVHLWTFGIFLFFFASLLSGLVQYVFYQYIDPLYLEKQIASLLDMLAMLSNQQGSEFLQMMREGLEKGGAPTAIEMVYQTILSNVFFGSLLSMLLAWIMRYRKLKINTLR